MPCLPQPLGDTPDLLFVTLQCPSLGGWGLHGTAGPPLCAIPEVAPALFVIATGQFVTSTPKWEVAILQLRGGR